MIYFNFSITKINILDGRTKIIVNPNLLDNWYFVNPVNQRNETEYTNNGYTIDRWKVENSSQFSIKITENGIEIYNQSSSSGSFEQLLPISYIPKNIDITFSILYISNNTKYITSTTLKLPLGNDYFDSNNVYCTNGGYIDVVSSGTTTHYRYVFTGLVGTITLIAAKLEFGTKQTLAYLDDNGIYQLTEIPDYAEQLAICQRYYLTTISGHYFSGQMYSNANGVFLIPTPCLMRAIPAFSILTIGSLNNYDSSIKLIIPSSILEIERCDSIGIKLILFGVTNGFSGCAVLRDYRFAFDSNL